MTLIFDGDDISASFIDRGSDTVVFSFSGYKAHEQKDARYGYSALEKYGISAVFFVAKKDHWWQTPEMEPAIAAAIDATRGFTKRFTFGQSMGGFGAVMFAKRLGSSYFATAPQLTVSENTAPLHPVWADCIARQDIVYDDIKGEASASSGLIIFDPRDRRDACHAALLDDVNGTHNTLACPFSSHYIPKSLLEMGLLSDITEKIFRDEITVTKARKAIRDNRLRSETYFYNILQNIEKRRTRGALNAFYRYVFHKSLHVDTSLLQKSHIRSFIYSKAASSIWPLGAQETPGIVSFIPHHDILHMPGRTSGYISIGSDPQFMVRTKDRGRLVINWLSSESGIAQIFWTQAALGVERFQQSHVTSFKVKPGINSIEFNMINHKADCLLRFDPLNREAIIEIESLAVLA